MGQKAPTPIPIDVIKPPPPPPPPPCRIFKDILFVGLVETKESKQALKDYNIYMNGYRDGVNSQRNT